MKRFFSIVFFICFLIFAASGTTFAQTSPTISAITAPSTISKYSKFEISFSVSTVATEPQFPYENTSPAPGVTAQTGITVDGIFTDPTGQEFKQPAFYYQVFDDNNGLPKSGRDWLYPTDTFQWKVRFSPNKMGTWQYRLTVTDKNGTTQTSNTSFTVTDSNKKGFVKVSESDSRYFEYDNGSYFPGLGYNENSRRIDWVNPIQGNETKLQTLGQNGIQFVRIWLSQWSIYGSQWAPWRTDEQQLGYFPKHGYTVLESYPGNEASIRLDPTATPPISCMVFGRDTYKIALKQNTNYFAEVRYKSTNLQPTNVSIPFGLVLKMQSCTGTNLTSLSQASTGSGWPTMQGTFTSGSLDEMNIYLALENVASGQAYIDSVSIREDKGGGLYGVNIVPKPTMNHHMYFDQRNSYAFDRVLELAEQQGVTLRPVIHEKQDHMLSRMDSSGTLTTVSDDNNFYGNRNMTRVRWLQRAWWRYLQARWGYSTSIHSWELLNEGDPAYVGHFTLADELGQYMHCEVFSQTVTDGQKCTLNHPNDHLVSTSNWHSFPRTNFWANSTFPNVDFADIHQYIPKDGSIQQYIPADRSPVHFYDTALATSELSLATQLIGTGKPIVRGETGFTDNQSEPSTVDLLNDKDGIWLHDMLWAGLNQGGLYDSGNWYPHLHIHRTWIESVPGSSSTQPPVPYQTCSGSPTFSNGNWRFSCSFDHRDEFKYYYDFIKDIPLSNGNYVDIAPTVGNSNLRAWGQKDATNGNAHIWVQNKNHTWKNVVDNVVVIPETGEVDICGFDTFANTNLKLEQWNTYTGTPLPQVDIPVQNTGCITLSVTNLTTDVAYKILNPNQSNPTPTGNPQKPGDLNNDSNINLIDLSTLLSNFGKPNQQWSTGDFNNDGSVNLTDLSILLANFGK